MDLCEVDMIGEEEHGADMVRIAKEVQNKWE